MRVSYGRCTRLEPRSVSNQYLAKEEIVAAALDRRMYIRRLRDAAAVNKPASTLRELQHDIDDADKRLAAATDRYADLTGSC